MSEPHCELIQYEDNQSIQLVRGTCPEDMHAMEQRYKEDKVIEGNERLKWHIERSRALSQELQALKNECLQLKEHNSEASRTINVLKRQCHQHKPQLINHGRTWFSPCPSSGRDDLPPAFIAQNRQSGQCLSERGFKVLYA
jgi:hypothetical protein